MYRADPSLFIFDFILGWHLPNRCGAGCRPALRAVDTVFKPLDIGALQEVACKTGCAGTTHNNDCKEKRLLSMFGSSTKHNVICYTPIHYEVVVLEIINETGNKQYMWECRNAAWLRGSVSQTSLRDERPLSLPRRSTGPSIIPLFFFHLVYANLW